MSWERAEQHNCNDGNICYGHKVEAKWIPTGIEGQMQRITTCTRCKSECSSEQIAPHREFRV